MLLLIITKVQFQKYVEQYFCWIFLLVLFWVFQPAAKITKVVPYNELMWNSVLKTIEITTVCVSQATVLKNVYSFFSFPLCSKWHSCFLFMVRPNFLPIRFQPAQSIICVTLSPSHFFEECIQAHLVMYVQFLPLHS